MGDQPTQSRQVQNTNGNTSSTNTVGPNPVIAGKLDNLTGNAWDWMGQNMNAPAYYPGSTVAAPSAAQQAARDTTWNWATNGLTSLGSKYAPTLDYLGDAAGGKYLDIDSNPYLQKSLEAMFRPQAEQFRDILAPAIDGKFAGAGRTSGGAHFDTTMRGVQDLERSQSDAAAKAASALYDSERNRQQGAATALPGALGQMGGQAADWLGMLNGIGAADTAQTQRQIDADVARYNYGTTAQPDWYAQMAQLLQAIYPGGQTVGSGTSSGTTTGTTTQSGGGGGAGQFIGPAVSVIGSVATMF